MNVVNVRRTTNCERSEMAKYASYQILCQFFSVVLQCWGRGVYVWTSPGYKMPTNTEQKQTLIHFSHLSVCEIIRLVIYSTYEYKLIWR